jgi:hypothetical protein
MKEQMRAIMAGVCVVALLTVVGAVIVPRLLGISSGDANKEIIEPAHWWKMTLNQDQAEIWRELWGKDITMAWSSRRTDQMTGKAGLSAPHRRPTCTRIPVRCPTNPQAAFRGC